MNGTTKMIIGVAVVAAIGVGVFIAYKKKPQWFGITNSNPQQGNPAIVTQDKTAQQIQAGTAAVKALSDILG